MSNPGALPTKQPSSSDHSMIFAYLAPSVIAVPVQLLGVAIGKSYRRARIECRESLECRVSNLRSRYEITVLGRKHTCDSQVDCFIEVLKALDAIDEGFMSRLSQHKDRKLRLVARQLADLHIDHHRSEFINAHAKQIFDGWWIWTNLSGDRVRRNITYACAFAGRKYGEDVVIHYESWGIKDELSDLLA